MIQRVIFFCLFLLLAAPAQASDFVKPTWPDLVRSLYRFNAVDINDDVLLDEYAQIAECDLYQQFSNDEFKWHRVRDAVRGYLTKNKDTYPDGYGYATLLQLDHYDFDKKLYRFSEKAGIHSVNALQIFITNERACGDKIIMHIPRIYRAIMERPVYVPGLPVDPIFAETILHMMQKDNNVDHVVTARFNMRILYIEPLVKRYEANIDTTHYIQGKGSPSDPMDINVHLDSIDFFEDEAMTKKVYTFKPKETPEPKEEPGPKVLY